MTRRTSSRVTASTRRTTSSIIKDLAGDHLLGAEPAGHAAGVLRAEEEPAFDQFFGLFELRLGDALFELLKLVHYAGEGLVGAGGIDASGYAEGAAVQVVVVVAVNVVGQPRFSLNSTKSRLLMPSPRTTFRRSSA